MKIPLDFTFDDDYTDYMTKYLPSINEFDEARHDFDSNQTSKLLFNLFNKYQETRRKPKHAVRHTKLSDDNYVLEALQDRNWPYFIDRIIEYSQGFLNLSDIDSEYITEINILRNTRDNFEIVKGVYNDLYDSVGVNLHELFKIMGYVNKQNIDTDLRNNSFFPWESKEQHIQQRILQTYKDFYYTTGRFPGRHNLISVPKGKVPKFITSTDVISPRSLYEKYVGRDGRNCGGSIFGGL